jgi:hypothetical protein
MHKRQVQVDPKWKRLDARGAVSTLFIGRGLVPESFAGLATWPRDYQQFPGFSTAVTVRAMDNDWPSNQVRRKRVGLSLLAADSRCPFLFFGLVVVKASRQPVLHQLLSLHLLSLTPHTLFWLHFVAVTFFTAAALTASHSFFRRRLSCFGNVKDVTSITATR